MTGITLGELAASGERDFGYDQPTAHAAALRPGFLSTLF